MKKNIAIIGHVNNGQTCLQSVIDSVLEKDRGIVIVEKQNPFEPEPIIIHNREVLMPREMFGFDKKGKLLPLPKSKYHK